MIDFIISKFLSMTGPIPLLYFGDVAIIDRWKWIIAQWPKTPLRFLELGCGSGAFSLSLAKRSVALTAISFQESEINKAQRRASILALSNTTFLKEDLRRLKDLDLGEPFDAAICLETLEHLMDDEGFLVALKTKIKPKGLLYISTPDEACPPLYLDKLSTVQDGGHVRLGYSFSSLGKLLEKCGYRVRAQAQLTGIVNQKLLNLERLLSSMLPNFFVFVSILPLRPLTIFDKPITRLLKRPSLSIALIAEVL